MAIWKFEVPRGERHLIRMPKEAAVISAGEQSDAVVVWATGCSSDQDVIAREFLTVPTGWEDLPPGARFIATLTLHGWYVVHVFEVGPVRF